MILDLILALLFEVPQQQPHVGWPTVTEMVLAAAGLGSTILNWRLSNVTTTMELRMTQENQIMRREIGERMEQLSSQFATRIDQITERFVPGSIDLERRSALANQVAELKGEVQKNRDRIHEATNTVQKLMLGPVENIHNSLRDKGKKITALEERQRVICDEIKELSEQIEDLERDK